jgi:hypothetical protein
VTEADEALVGQVALMLNDARATEAADFEGRSTELATQLAELVWTHSEGSSTGALVDTPGADRAVRSALNGLRYTRDLSPEALVRDRTRVALTVVNRVRAAVGSPTSGGATGPASRARTAAAPASVSVSLATPAVVPPADRQLIAAVEKALDDARLLEESDFDIRLADLAGQLADLVWGGSRNASDGSPRDAPGAARAIYAARNGLRYVRGLSADVFTGSRTRVALTLVARVRSAVGSTMPGAPAPGG